LSIYLIQFYGIGGPILATVLVGSLLNIPTYPYFCKLINIEWKKSFYAMYKIVFINLPSFIILYFVFNVIFNISNWFLLFVAGITSLLILYLPLIYYYLDKEEKNDIYDVLNKVLRRKISF
jgi:hypothetical protein